MGDQPVTEAERLREDLQRLHRELGRPPEVADLLEQEDFPGLPVFQDEFGSWYRALWAAGITPTEPPSYWTEKDIIQALQSLGDVPDDPPETGDLEQDSSYPSLDVIRDRFESWNDALEAAGYAQQQWTEDRLLEELSELGDTLGRKPKASDLENASEMATATTYARVFGSWNAALEAAGYSTTPVGSEPAYTKEELVGKLQSLAAELGRRPKLPDLETRDEFPSPSSYYRRFESWTDALAAAGLDEQADLEPDYTRADLLEALETLAERVDDTPQVADLDKYDDLPGPSTYYRRFESFTEALELSETR